MSGDSENTPTDSGVALHTFHGKEPCGWTRNRWTGNRAGTEARSLRLLVQGAVWRERGRLQGALGWGEQVEPQGPEEMKLSLNEIYCQSSLDYFRN